MRLVGAEFDKATCFANQTKLQFVPYERFNNTGRNARAYTGPTYHKLNDRMLELTKHTKDLAMDNWRLSRRMFALEQQMLRLSNSTSEDPGDDTFLSPPRERSTTSATSPSNPSAYAYEASSGFNTPARDSGQTEPTTPTCMMHRFGWKYEGEPRAPEPNARPPGNYTRDPEYPNFIGPRRFAMSTQFNEDKFDRCEWDPDVEETRAEFVRRKMKNLSRCNFPKRYQVGER